MRLRLLIILTLITALISLPMILQSRTTVKATTFTSENTPQVKRKSIQPDLPGTVNGATNPEAIPDTVAYELFMRSIADYPPERIFKDAGLAGDQIANAMAYLSSFQNAMSLFDQNARMIKKSGRGVDKLSQLQKKKEEYLDRGLNHYLPMILGADGGNKIRAYVNGRVKPKTKKVPASLAQNKRSKSDQADKQPTSRKALARYHAVSPALAYGVYVYCNAWHVGDNVFGSGSISSNYGDFNQYLVTTTVIAPNGSRWSTSQTGWDYAAVTDTEYLPIMPNDGTFTVEAVFEGTDGYVSSAFSATAVDPQVSIRSAQAIPPALPGPGSLNIFAEIQFSQGVPPAAEAIIELNEASNLNGVVYDVRAASGVGMEGTTNTRVVRVGGGAGVKVINWPINVTASGSPIFPGVPSAVINDVRIESGTPGIGFGAPTMPTTFTISAA